jgi:hypothetical protein
VHDAPEQPPKEAGELESGLRWSCLRSRSDSGESLVLMREGMSQIQSRWSKSTARVEASRLMWKLVGLPLTARIQGDAQAKRLLTSGPFRPLE